VLETFKLFEKWNKKTPISCETMTKKERQKEEIGSFRFLVRKSKEVNVDVKRSLSFQYKWQFMKAVGLKNWIINQVWIFRELFFWIIKKNRI
jgi:hypothetical protein